jgi:hypothetical protein
MLQQIKQMASKQTNNKVQKRKETNFCTKLTLVK